MVVADVSREPGQERTRLHVARRLERRPIERPLLAPLDVQAVEVVLRVEEVRAGGGGDEERQEVAEEKDRRAELRQDEGRRRPVGEQRQQRVPPLAGRAHERHQAHLHHEDGEVREQHRERMAHQLVVPLLRRRGLPPLLRGHGGEGADVGADQLRGVVVMIVVRLAPDPGRRHHVDAEGIEDDARQPRAAQERPVQEVVVEDELTHDEQPRDAGEREAQRPEEGLPERGQTREQERRGGEHVPPAAQPPFRHEGPGRFDQISPGSQRFLSRVRLPTYQRLRQKATDLLTSCTMTHYTGRP